MFLHSQAHCPYLSREQSGVLVIEVRRIRELRDTGHVSAGICWEQREAEDMYVRVPAGDRRVSGLVSAGA